MELTHTGDLVVENVNGVWRRNQYIVDPTNPSRRLGLYSSEPVAAPATGPAVVASGGNVGAGGFSRYLTPRNLVIGAGLFWILKGRKKKRKKKGA